MDTRTIEIEGVGPVNIARRKGTKRISMRVKPDGSVLVYHPWFAGQKEVLDFVIQHTGWVIKTRQKISEKRFVYQIGTTFKTKTHSITIVPVENGKLRAGRKGENVVLTIPTDIDIDSSQAQHFIKKVITEVCRREAKAHLPARTQELALEHGFAFQKVFIKNLKSKWGSCSSTGNINLNLSLMLLPQHLIDYIILHELAHLREHNHGVGFWMLLNALTNGKAKELDKEMKKNHRII